MGATLVSLNFAWKENKIIPIAEKKSSDMS